MNTQPGALGRSLAEKRMLQLSVAVAGLVPVLGGTWGVLSSHLGTPGVVNHERYLSGLLVAIGLAFWSTLSDIEHKSGQFRLLTTLVFVGGLCRLVGIAMGDGTSWSIMAPLLMELLVAPMLCLWQSRLDPAHAISR